tara:strand:+ start:14119 stop:14439 length:321 start_codon:yes stop_codon:yes gene_type:complete
MPSTPYNPSDDPKYIGAIRAELAEVIGCPEEKVEGIVLRALDLMLLLPISKDREWPNHNLLDQAFRESLLNWFRICASDAPYDPTTRSVMRLVKIPSGYPRKLREG